MLRIDRHFLRAFLRHLWRRFLADECFQTAGALAYTTVFALVPLTAAVVGILSAFPVFSAWTDTLSEFIFRNFVPATGATVREYLFTFAGNARRMTTVGAVILVGSALTIMAAIETRLNRIWRVRRRRGSVVRFLLYWTALTLVPLLLAAGLALSSYLFALPLLRGAVLQPQLEDALLRLMPFAATLVALLLLYILVPNRRVPWRHALTGALLGALLFELAKWGFGAYVSSVPSWQQLYGALAVIPIFLVWVYLSWVIVLLGASLTASLSAFEYRPEATRMPADAEFLAVLLVLARLVAAQHRGERLQGDGLRLAGISAELRERCLETLVRAGIAAHGEGLGWVLLRAPGELRLAEVYRAGRYHVPLDAAVLARWSEQLPAPLQRQLATLAAQLRRGLDLPATELLEIEA